MDRGAWQATAHGAAESDRTEYVLNRKFLLSPVVLSRATSRGVCSMHGARSQQDWSREGVTAQLFPCKLPPKPTFSLK